MVLVTKDIPYRLLGAGQPTIACTRTSGIAANPQSRDCAATSLQFEGSSASFPYREVTTVLNGDNDVITGHFNPTFIYNPAADSIISIDFSLDFRNTFSFGDGQAFGPVLEQDGIFYVIDGVLSGGREGAFLSGSVEFDWTNAAQSAFVAADFSVIGGVSTPDFSTSGSPITFGFMTGNFKGGIGGVGIIVGYDNFSTVINTSNAGEVTFTDGEFDNALWTTPTIDGPSGGQVTRQVPVDGDVVASTVSVKFTDGEFVIAPWVATTINGPVGGQTVAQVLIGGNPDAYREVTTNVAVTTSTFHSDPTDVYDPADGEIETIAFSLDFLEIVNPSSPGIFSGIGFGWALEQAGCFYGQTPFVTSNKIGWTNVSDANPAFGGPFTGDLDALVATDFPGPNGGVVAAFSETEFPIGPWTTFAVSGPVGGQTAVQVLAGGNPDAYRQVTTQTQVNVFTFHSDPANVYDPAVEGPIASIGFSLEFLEIVGGGDGQSFGPGLEQNGSHYGFGPFVTRDQVGWANIRDAELQLPFTGDLDARVATDLPLVGAGGGPPNPEFSASGAPITFGFITGNTLGINKSVGYDNFSVSVNLACGGPSFPDFSTSGAPITFGFFTTNTSGGGEVSGFDNFSATIDKVGIAGDSGVNSARLRDGDTDLGIANEWSVMLWAAPSNLAPVNTETLFEIHTLDGDDDSNAFRIDIDSTGTIDFRLFSLTGTLMKSYQMDALDDLGTPGRQGFFFEENQWAQIVVTWLGSASSMKVYRNGVLMNSDMALVTDLIGEQENRDRSLSLGARVSAENAWAGFMHSAALWNSELSASDIRVLWNQGAGSNVQLHTGQDDYLADRDLESWWRLGFSCTEPLIDHTSASRDLSPTGPTGPTGAP